MAGITRTGSSGQQWQQPGKGGKKKRTAQEAPTSPRVPSISTISTGFRLEEVPDDGDAPAAQESHTGTAFSNDRPILDQVLEGKPLFKFDPNESLLKQASEFQRMISKIWTECTTGTPSREQFQAVSGQLEPITKTFDHQINDATWKRHLSEVFPPPENVAVIPFVSELYHAMKSSMAFNLLGFKVEVQH